MGYCQERIYFLSIEEQHKKVSLMAMEANEIEALIREAFPKAEILVSGNDGVHMAAQVVAEEFRGINRVKQHQMVYAALKGKMDGSAGELHALALTTKVPD